MSNELGFASTVIYSTGGLYRAAAPRKQNLGGSILLGAIRDYRSLNDQEHEEASQFLYPKTADWRERYEWAVAVADGVNPEWLRDALDRCKGKWDVQRLQRKLNKHKKAL